MQYIYLFIELNLASLLLGSFLDVSKDQVEGYIDKIQEEGDGEEPGDHTIKLPSNMGNEARYHLNLCLVYMRIIDKEIVDQVPKILIMMLVYKTLDYMDGGNSYPGHSFPIIVREFLKANPQQKVGTIQNYFLVKI